MTPKSFGSLADFALHMALVPIGEAFVDSLLLQRIS
jgi:hypothetical protein